MEGLVRERDREGGRAGGREDMEGMVREGGMEGRDGGREGREGEKEGGRVR